MLESADRIVLAARPRLADLHALATWGETRSWERVSLVTIGDGPYPDGEIADALGIEVLGRVPWDPDAADALMTMPVTDRQLRLTPLVRCARSLADRPGRNGDYRHLRSGSDGRGCAFWSNARSFDRYPAGCVRSWRVAPGAESTNGTTPEGVTR